MPKLPHYHTHYPEKGTGNSVCRCGHSVTTPTAPVRPPPTKRAPVWQEVTWEGVRMAVQVHAGEATPAVVSAVMDYLLARGVNVAPPF